jgi:hypothetical protein
VDERDHQTSLSESGDSPADDSAAPRPAASQAGPTLAYYGDAARVNEGFAIALRLLGMSPPMVNDDARVQSEDGE